MSLFKMTAVADPSDPGDPGGRQGVVAVELTISWDGEVVRMDRLEAPRIYCLGEGTPSAPCDFALPHEILGARSAEMIRVLDDRAVLILHDGMTGTRTDRSGNTRSLLEREGGDIELPEGASAHVDLPGGRIGLDIRSCAARRPVELRARRDLGFLRPLGASVALHLIVFAAFAPMTLGRSVEGQREKPDILFIRRMLEASHGERDPGEVGERREGATVDESVVSDAGTSPETSASDVLRMRTPNPSPDGGKPDSGKMTTSASSSRDAGPSRNPFSAGDRWVGTYTCAQGLTSLELVIVGVSGNTIQARFEFNFVAGSADGSFELTGKWNTTTRGVTFVPGEWISKPGPGWMTVAMDGFVDSNGREFAGMIPTAGCGSFSVVK